MEYGCTSAAVGHVREPHVCGIWSIGRILILVLGRSVPDVVPLGAPSVMGVHRPRNNNCSLLVLQTLVPQSLLVPLLGQSTSTFRPTGSNIFPVAFVLAKPQKSVSWCSENPIWCSGFSRGPDAMLLFRTNVFILTMIAYKGTIVVGKKFSNLKA